MRGDPRRASLWCAAALVLAGCRETNTPPDTAADTGADVPAVDAPGDVPTDVPTDVPGDVPTDVMADVMDATDGAFVCPRESLDPIFSVACAGLDGTECRYGYTVPGCGGRTQRCRSGRWEEEHTDPTRPDCFDAGVDAGRDASADAAPDNACAAAGGICVGRAADCEAAGGAVAAAGAPGCRFSDGDGACCVPPAARPTGDACADHGGVCAPIAGCNFVRGAFAPPRCGGVGVVCCVTSAVCGQEREACCAPGGPTTFRASCDRGRWTCTIAGTELMPRDRCP